jgi:peroxiredoxin
LIVAAAVVCLVSATTSARADSGGRAAMVKWEKLREKLSARLERSQTPETARKVVEEIRKFAEAHEGSEAAGLARFEQGTILSQLGDQKAAAESLRKASKDVRDAEASLNIRHKLAQLTVTSGTSAPDFTAKSLDGRTVQLSSLRGKAVLLDFWATWCTPCIEEFPRIRKLRDKFKRSELEIIGVSTDVDEKAWRKFLSQRRLPWTQVLSATASPIENPAILYGVEEIPDLVVIDRHGMIVARQILAEDLEDAVEYALSAEKNSRPFSASMNRLAPALAVQEWVRGRPTTLDRLQGKVVLLDFFQIVCPECRRTHPEIARLHQRYQGKGLEVIGVAVAFERLSTQTPAKIRKYVNDEAFPYPVAVDKDLIKSFRRYRAEGSPYSALIDRNGEIRYLDFFDAVRIEPLIGELLNEKPRRP